MHDLRHLLTLLIARKTKRSLLPYRATTIVSAALVAAAGHYGGTLTHGEGYLTELLTTSPPPLTVSNDAPLMPVAFPAVTYPHRTEVISDDWQLFGFCQGVDYSRLAITTR